MKEVSINHIFASPRNFATRCRNGVTAGSCENRVKSVIQDVVLMSHPQKAFSVSSQLDLFGLYTSGVAKSGNGWKSPVGTG